MKNYLYVIPLSAAVGKGALQVVESIWGEAVHTSPEFLS